MKKWSKLYEMRNKRGWTRAEVAEAVGVNEVTVWRWDKESSKMLLCHAHEVAKILRCKMEDFI
jgi:DNA-binding XRE family transcriptional regulator